MKLKNTRLHILHKPKDLSNVAKTGVSLHCHTQFSKEMLDFVPHYAERLPIISYFWKREQGRYLKREGRAIDFSTAYWQPPLTEHDVFRSETEQINGAGLDALVSITDHDSIVANLNLIEEHANAKAPISMEWTVPFEYGFFHVGVHNLPPARAAAMTDELLAYTFGEVHDKDRLHDLFGALNAVPDVLVVLNHPLWDIEIVGQERHEILLKNFLKEYAYRIHAFEINGFRSWAENKAVIEIAEALNMPLVTGGDRHGCRPNTVINLSGAKTFSEFAEEVRVDKRTEIVLMPEYKQPLQSRQLQSFAEILHDYPEYPEVRRRWFDRVYYDAGKGEGLIPLSGYGWERGGPFWLRAAIKTLGFFGSPRMRPFFRAIMQKKDYVPLSEATARFEVVDLSEIVNGSPTNKTQETECTA